MQFKREETRKGGCSSKVGKRYKIERFLTTSVNDPDRLSDFLQKGRKRESKRENIYVEFVIIFDV
jgi:hypothetical protein